MNDIENDYIELELPNILLARKKGELPLAEIPKTHTSPFLLPLVLRLARARPNWKLVATRRNTISGRVGQFAIYEANAKLGAIWEAYERRDNVVCMDNSRMAKGRQRGTYTATKDLNKAFKLVTKNFYGQTTSELVGAAVARANSLVGSMALRQAHIFTQKYGGLRDFMVPYVMSNWEQISQAAIGAGVSSASIEGMEEAYAASIAMDIINQTNNDKSGVTVLIRGDEYLVVTNGVVSVFDTDHLPPHIKRSLGILKMLEENNYAEGHGVRVSKDTFFVSSKAGAAS